MKFSIVASLAAVVALANAETCDYAVVGPTLQSLGQPIASCMTATDNSYNLARATTPPTAEQAAAICAKCSDFVTAVNKLTWPDCTMNVGGKNQTLTAYFDAMVGGCKEGGSTTPTVTTAATTAPSASTTEAGSGSSASSSTSNSTAADEVSAPSNSTPVPSTTQSAGYTLQVGVFAASAVATTIALAF